MFIGIESMLNADPCRQVWCLSFVSWRGFTVCKTILHSFVDLKNFFEHILSLRNCFESEVFVVSFSFYLNILPSLCRICTFIKLSQVPRQVKFSCSKVLTFDWPYSLFIRTHLFKFKVYFAKQNFLQLAAAHFIFYPLFYLPGQECRVHNVFNLNCECLESYISILHTRSIYITLSKYVIHS